MDRDTDPSLLAQIVEYVSRLPADARTTVQSTHTPGPECFKRPRLAALGSTGMLCVCVTCLKIVHICTGSRCKYASDLEPGRFGCPYTGVFEDRQVLDASYEETTNDVYDEDGEYVSRVEEKASWEEIANCRLNATHTVRAPAVIEKRAPPTMRCADMFDYAMEFTKRIVDEHDVCLVVARESVRHWLIIQEDIVRANGTRVCYPPTTSAYKFMHHVLAVLTAMGRNGYRIDGRAILLLPRDVRAIPAPTVVARAVPGLGTGTREANRLCELWRKHIDVRGSWDALYVDM